MPSGPSKLAALRAAQPLVDAHWPGHPDIRLKIASLTCSQVLECRGAAEAELKRHGIADTALNADAKEEETATQVLGRVLRDADDPRRPFTETIDELRDNMSPDQRAELFERWNDHRLATDPAPSELGQELLAAVDEAIKKKDRKLLRSFGSAVLASFLLTTAAQPSISPTGKSESSLE